MLVRVVRNSIVPGKICFTSIFLDLGGDVLDDTRRFPSFQRSVVALVDDVALRGVVDDGEDKEVVVVSRSAS